MPDSATNQPSGGPKKVLRAPRRRRGGLFNLILIVGIIVTISLFIWAEQQRRETEQKLGQTAKELEEARKSAQTSGQEVADQVLGKLRQHIDLPTDPQPTVATIIDADALKKTNEFYEPAQNGDHLIITKKRAILYDPKRNIIRDVVPVIVDAEQATSTSPTPVAEKISPESPSPLPSVAETTPGKTIIPPSPTATSAQSVR